MIPCTLWVVIQFQKREIGAAIRGSDSEAKKRLNLKDQNRGFHPAEDVEKRESGGLADGGIIDGAVVVARSSVWAIDWLKLFI